MKGDWLQVISWGQFEGFTLFVIINQGGQQA